MFQHKSLTITLLTIFVGYLFAKQILKCVYLYKHSHRWLVRSVITTILGLTALIPLLYLTYYILKQNHVSFTYILKSVIVGIGFYYACRFCYKLMCNCCAAKKRNDRWVLKGTLACISVVWVLVALICFGEYVYPFERDVKFELYATMEIPPEYTPEQPKSMTWHAAYSQDGIFDGSFFFDTEEISSPLGFDWPTMDFENHTYIITYGYELDSLSYNIWEDIDIPYYTGAKVGHAVLKNEYDANMVYIYEIAKIRIDVDH